jgi:hypothetical protein
MGAVPWRGNQEPVYGGEDDAQDEVEEWMKLAYPYSMPWVGYNGEEVYRDFSRLQAAVGHSRAV